MKIGIDLDWTLADHIHYWRRLFGDVDRVTVMWLADDEHPWFRELIQRIWFVAEPALTDAAWVEVVRLLRARHTVYVVTNREEWERERIVDWLLRNGLHVDDVLCIGMDGDKGEVGVDVLIDDTLSKCYDVLRRGGQAFWWLRNLVDRTRITPHVAASLAPIKLAYSAWEVYERIVR